ncbi:hypothetical protein [Alienimonas californiensis]|uniref:Uncharacterized protein n=1 Tax=Alienimonas californiensis TaxID=2527989 RepID=A0A517P756_9PLAN|nr:hypothetical protein [Alienimonas californiensis]QDT15185.1 hypothetical protein CA12_12660 [Alienimonas californiensis]
MSDSLSNASEPFPLPAADDPHFAEEILAQVRAVLEECEKKTRPPEVVPYRDQLFALFAAAFDAGLTEDPDERAEPSTTGDAPPEDLSADGLCKALGEQWGLAAAARANPEEGPALSQAHVAKVRLLLSLMHLWTNWDLAWRRWPDYH